MPVALTVSNSVNDLLLIDTNGDELTKFDKYFRFTGPLVKRSVERQGFYLVSYEVKAANRRITEIRNVNILNGETMNTPENHFLVRVMSVANSAPNAIKNELEGADFGVRNLFQTARVVYASVMANSKPVYFPIDFSEVNARLLVDILAKDGTVAAVYDRNTMTDAVYFSPAVVGEKESAAVPKPVSISKIDSSYFYMEEEVAVAANIMFSLFSNGDYDGVHTLLLSGPSGYGKTAFCAVLAEKLGMSLVNFDMSLVLETEEVMGHRAIEDGSTLFKLNEFAQKVQEGNVIIVLDELNRTFAGALNALFPFLDHRRGNNFQGQQIKVGKRVLFIGTRNVGTGYVGTHQSDEALLRRFEFSVTVGSLPKEEEITLLMKRTGCAKDVANKIAKVAKEIRESDAGVNCPPSTTLLVAQMATKGVAPRVTFQLNLVNKLEDIEQRRTIEELLNRGFGQTFADGLANSNFSKVF